MAADPQPTQFFKKGIGIPQEDVTFMKDPQYTVRDGFVVCEKTFTFPSSLSGLDSKTQRDLEICNLFLNEKFTISDIIRMTNDDYEAVVQTVITRRAVFDRRKKPREPRNGERSPERD